MVKVFSAAGHPVNRWDETVDFTRRIQLAPSAEAICCELLALTSRYGLTGLIAGTIPAPGLNPTAQKSHILLAEYPEAWLRRYVALSYAYVDPVLHQVVTDPGTPFAWYEARADPDHEREAQHMMGEAREHGLAAGFAVPMVTLEGDLATISFAGEQLDLPQTARGLISLVGVFAICRAFQLQDRRKPEHQALTTRELDCLKWCAEGKTDWEISVILGISESTVRSHVNAVRIKLNSANKTHMVAEALRASLIR
jgi:LuxR family quorum sensing-dependent transcriptional regulator